MFLKLTSTYKESTKTYPVLVNTENIEWFEPVEEGEDFYEFGVRTRVFSINSQVDVVESIYEIAAMIDRD